MNEQIQTVVVYLWYRKGHFISTPLIRPVRINTRRIRVDSGVDDVSLTLLPNSDFLKKKRSLHDDGAWIC